VEADLQEVYGVALGDLFTGALTWRRLLVLLRGLPATSRLARARDPRAEWTTSDYLMAQAADNAALVADELAVFRWMWTSVNRRKGSNAPTRPKAYPRLPRPGQQAERTAAKPRRRMSPGQAARAYAAARAGSVT
jgi:hypothetical protein